MNIVEKPNKILKDKFMIFSFGWALVFYILGFILSKFYLFSIGLLPLALYELFRTEGLKNTKPLSLVVSVVLVLQFLHSTGIFLFPLDISFLFDFLPFSLSDTTDAFLFGTVVLLVILSALLIKYTWGSITKFLAIALLVGSILQGLVFWSDVEKFVSSDEGQQVIEEQQDEIRENLIYRLKQEFL